MKFRFCPRHLMNKLVVLLLSAGFALPLSGAPITYTESLAASSGKLGGVAFSNAILFLTFQGDTTNVVPYSVPRSNGFEISQGTASVQVMDSGSGVVIARGTFLPAAGIFISADATNGGIGFGSFAVVDQHSPNFPGIVAYPGGLLGAWNYDLKRNVQIGFGPTKPNFAYVLSNVQFPFADWQFCRTPPRALPTTSGDLYVNCSPSQIGVWKRGTFSATLSVTAALESPKVYFPGVLKITGAQTFEVNGALPPEVSVEELKSKGATIQFGKLSLEIPIDSIQGDANGLTFSGITGGIAVELSIAHKKDADTMLFQMKGRGEKLSGVVDSSPVLITLGDK